MFSEAQEGRTNSQEAKPLTGGANYKRAAADNTSPDYEAVPQGGDVWGVKVGDRGKIRPP